MGTTDLFVRGEVFLTSLLPPPPPPHPSNHWSDNGTAFFFLWEGEDQGQKCQTWYFHRPHCNFKRRQNCSAVCHGPFRRRWQCLYGDNKSTHSVTNVKRISRFDNNHTLSVTNVKPVLTTPAHTMLHNYVKPVGRYIVTITPPVVLQLANPLDVIFSQ